MYMIDINHWKQRIPVDYSNESSVWIYQTTQALTIEQQRGIQQQIDAFTAHWLSHKQPVKAWGTIFFDHFMVLMADENVTKVSGCSKDSMMRFIQSLESAYHITLLDRMPLAFLLNNQITFITLNALPEKIVLNWLDAETLYFDNTIHQKHQLLNKWIVKIQDSWLKQQFDKKKMQQLSV